MKKIIDTNKAPTAIGPYSQAVQVGNLIFTSGQIPLDPTTGVLVDGGIDAQATQVFINLKAVLEEAGSSLDKILKTTCFINDMNNFAVVNEIYGKFLSEGTYPARSAVEVSKLPKGAMVEIEAIAEL